MSPKAQDIPNEQSLASLFILIKPLQLRLFFQRLLFNSILNASLFLTFLPTSPLLSQVSGIYLGVAGYRLPRQPHRETLYRCQGNLLLRLLTLFSLPEIQFERARTNLKAGRGRDADFWRVREGREENQGRGGKKNMVRL